MLGQCITDRDGVESDAGSDAGLGYLATQTELTAAKNLRRVSGVLTLDDDAADADGYCNHCGATDGEIYSPTAAEIW